MGPACRGAAAVSLGGGELSRLSDGILRPLVKRWGVTTNAENIRARDTRVIAAAWRIIAREGVLALTVKALADEAGVVVSSMRYTMPSRAVVRERALQALAPRIRDRVSALSEDLDGDLSKPGPCSPRCCRSTRSDAWRRPCWWP